MNNEENKIKIPYYRRIIQRQKYEALNMTTIEKPKRSKPRQPSGRPMRPQLEPEAIRQPLRQTEPKPFPTIEPLPIPERRPEIEKEPIWQPTPIPAPSFIEEKKPLQRALENIVKPIVYLFIGKQIIDNWIQSKISDPIYNAMMQDPVLSVVLREAEQAELDIEILVNYFANYDWDNVDLDSMLVELTALVGAVGAARIIIYFIGRRVVFRM